MQQFAVNEDAGGWFAMGYSKTFVGILLGKQLKYDLLIHFAISPAVIQSILYIGVSPNADQRSRICFTPKRHV